MFGYASTLIVALICGASFVYMDLDAKSDFFSLFLPFAFVVSGLFCVVSVVIWFFWKFGAPSSGSFPWSSNPWADWYTSTADTSSPSTDGGSDAGSDGGDGGGD